jgi:hypothetical protein
VAVPSDAKRHSEVILHGPLDRERALAALEAHSGMDLNDWRDLGDRELESLFAAAARLFGTSPVAALAGRPADEVARGLLLQIQVGRANGSGLALVEDRFRCGDNRERQAILRALPWLDDPRRFVRLAVHACRTNVTPVFEAIACDNPYPAEHFSDDAFNQMVLKTMFVGLPVARVVGLDRRRSAELRRMAEGYASERRAAGRPVPDDVALLTGGLLQLGEHAA